jgi:hypothetical protein
MSVVPHLAGSASGLSGALTVAVGAVLTTAVGLFVTASAAPFAVLGGIVGVSMIAFAAAAYVLWVDLRDPVAE